jgi:hypothetical protein
MSSSPSSVRPPRRSRPGTIPWSSLCPLRALAVAVLVLFSPGCARDAVRVVLQVDQGPPRWDVRNLGIHAQVTGPQARLRYRWYSVSGECDPQESDEPATVFKFADGTIRDRVSVEVLRDDRRVAYGELDVQLDARQALLATQPVPDVRIEITRIPPYEAGGPDTRADIRGRVSGQLAPDHRVVIYARADVWYIQPVPASVHPIRPDGSWESWTHTGSSYAALVVRPGFDPAPRLDVLPQVGASVVARTIVEGARP